MFHDWNSWFWSKSLKISHNLTKNLIFLRIFSKLIVLISFLSFTTNQDSGSICLIKTSSWRQLPLKIPRKKLIFLKRWVSFQCFVFSYRSVLHPALSFGIQKPSHVANIHWKFKVFLPSSFQVIKVLHLTDPKTV